MTAEAGGGDDLDRAAAWLARPVAARFKDRDRLAAARELDPLRGRVDLKAAVALLPERVPPPRPAR